MSDSPTPWPEEGTGELLNDEMRERLSIQRSAFERLDARAAIVLGASFAAVQFVAGQPVESWWLPPALAGYVVAMALSLIAVWPRRFEELDPDKVVIGHWLYPPNTAAANLASARRKAFRTNVRRQGHLVRVVRGSVIAAVLGATMSVAHLTLGERTDAGRNTERGTLCEPGAGDCGTPAGEPAGSRGADSGAAGD